MELRAGFDPVLRAHLQRTAEYLPVRRQGVAPTHEDGVLHTSQSVRNPFIRPPLSEDRVDVATTSPVLGRSPMALHTTPVEP